MGDILVITTMMGSKTVESAASVCSYSETFSDSLGFKGCQGITTGQSQTVDALNLQWSEAQMRNSCKMMEAAKRSIATF